MANFSRKSFKNWTKNKASLDISLKTEFEELTNCFKWNSKETPQIGAAFDSDKFTLPKPFPWCQKNLAGLITGGYFLPVEERNILLTGNPRLKFDTYILVYSSGNSSSFCRISSASYSLNKNLFQHQNH